ncbi:11-beta-hydroxysteroid dehydrogenase 1A isoform X2 [Vitis vinifera]|uniref:11-beta-hydroxysteroid dehydrogenase 1A isoform X2 n=1 Tax=Vitis vinifera TaxID=29760 RepID=UPI00053F3163|nr:11-beta-hydroxysteroid dehydrogenase 1A isoform X2 [Vitis vinifera]|eukprot:XP_010656930.1 PREDICTED: 11-beta-hydroxysteroid dehydrogenase 1B isoform X2 [Vitis vinifera]
MDLNYLIHKSMSLVIIPLVLVSLCWILPLLFLFRLIFSFFQFFSQENMAGKVVLITGASSGIGEQMAYEYAKKGACLVIVARRKKKLEEVAAQARELGSPDVVVVCGDVSNINECKQFIDEAIHHFGRLDHLVNNAGVTGGYPFEEITDITKFALLMASKAALIGFFEALRIELAPSVTITIATLGIIDSEMSRGKILSKDGELILSPENSKGVFEGFPVMNTEPATKSIVDSICRGERYVTEPQWYGAIHLLKDLCPEMVEWYYSIMYFKKKSSLFAEKAD